MSEDQNIEYKRSWRDEYLKWVCGFANAQGGVLYIGKNDAGDGVGLWLSFVGLRTGKGLGETGSGITP